MQNSFSPQTRNAAVLEELRARILRRELKPGDRILADSIAEELGVSRIPVREALRVLVGENQVSYEPHRGYFVTELRFADLLELYLMRHLLEAEALRRSVPALTEEDFEEMQAALDDLADASARGAVADHSVANRRFHFAFLERLQMPLLLREIKGLYDQCDGYGALYYNRPSHRSQSQAGHLELYAAARARDVERVVSTLAEHRDEVVEALADVLQESDAAV